MRSGAVISTGGTTPDPIAADGGAGPTGGGAAPATGEPSSAPAPVVTVPALVDSTPTAASPSVGAAPDPAAQPVNPVPADPPAPAPAPADPAPAQEPAAPTTVQPPYNTVLGWHGSDNVAYLSFDDGPSPATGRILDVLAGAGVKATFCEVGQKVGENPALVQRVVAEGHTLCNHSWDHHSPFDTLAPADIDAEIGQTQQAMASAAGTTARYFRAPEGRFGAPDGQVLLACQRARTIPLAWGVDSLDWKKPGAATIVSTVLNTVTPGAVILLHDGGGDDREQTIAALPGIISGLQAAGYALAALPVDPIG